MKLTQIWVGRFTHEAPKDYFTEVYSEDDEDLPLSRFIGEQGQTWLDHDWLEITKKDTLVPIAELVKYLGHKSKPKVLAKAQELDISHENDNYDKDLLSLKSQMSESEIQEAEKLALEWIDAKQYNPDYFRGLKRNPLR